MFVVVVIVVRVVGFVAVVCCSWSLLVAFGVVACGWC